MWIIISLMVLFFISTCALAYACFNMLKKIEVHEEWIEYFRGEVVQVKKRLKMVDDKELFPNDEDVGFVFSEIQRIINEFDEKIK
jgi:hypothetical protein